MTTFDEALANWKQAALDASEKRLTHEIAYGRAISSSQAKNAEGRKGESDVATADTRVIAERAEIEERAANHLVMFLRGRNEDMK
jgi:hypothetical protein